MAGLFDTLNLGSRSLQTYRKAIDTTGHNLANVHTAGYTRQRVEIESVTGVDELGPTGMGAEAVRVVRMHSAFLDKQLYTEASITGSLEAKDDALRQALSALQETLDRNAANGTATSGISQALSDFFTAVQSVSNNPSSIPERQVLMQKAQALSQKFNQTDARLGAVEAGLDTRLESEVETANTLLADIARLNQTIASQEIITDGSANDLRDTRQGKIEALSKLIKVDAVEQENGMVNLVIGGSLVVDGAAVVSQIETFDPGDGNKLIRLAGQGDALAAGGGSIEGTISVRDGQIATVRNEINALATTFITEVNRVHAGGFNLSGGQGNDFFVGTDAADIRVNDTLLRDPSLLQASGRADAVGDNIVIRALGDLQHAAQAAIGGQTFSNKQIQTVATVGQELAQISRDLEDQNTIQKFVKGQRDSVSAVSVDEEMANLVMFQKAFQASAKLISMTDELLATIIQM